MRAERASLKIVIIIFIYQCKFNATNNNHEWYHKRKGRSSLKKSPSWVLWSSGTLLDSIEFPHSKEISRILNELVCAEVTLPFQWNFLFCKKFHEI